MTLEATEVKIRQAVEADRETLTDLIVRAFGDVTTNRRREQEFGVIGGRSWDEWKPISCARLTSLWSSLPK